MAEFAVSKVIGGDTFKIKKVRNEIKEVEILSVFLDIIP